MLYALSSRYYSGVPAALDTDQNSVSKNFYM